MRVPVITTGLSFGGAVADGSAAWAKEGVAAMANTAATGIRPGVLNDFSFLRRHFTTVRAENKLLSISPIDQFRVPAQSAYRIRKGNWQREHSLFPRAETGDFRLHVPQLNIKAHRAN